MDKTTYIQWLTKRLFKMLPMSDTLEEIETSHLREYISSMSIQVDGSLKTFPELGEDVNYVAIANMLHYWDANEIVTDVFKREIRGALSALNQIEKQQGDV